MKNFKEIIKETLQHIPPNISKQEYSKRTNIIKDELEKKTGMKYNHIGSAYNSNNTGASEHHFSSEKFKTKFNKVYGGATKHDIRVIVDHNRKISKIDSVASNIKPFHGDWVKSDYEYDHTPTKNIGDTISHVSSIKHKEDHFKYNSEHSGKILHPHLFK